VTKLVMIHIGPRADERALEAEARATFANAVVGTDLMPIGQ
jgi:ribonuclease BN (tRNA processing enzyme)